MQVAQIQSDGSTWSVEA